MLAVVHLSSQPRNVGVYSLVLRGMIFQATLAESNWGNLSCCEIVGKKTAPMMILPYPVGEPSNSKPKPPGNH